MAISRDRKNALIAEYKEQFEESNGIVMADYMGLTVPQMQDLRRRAREQDGRVYVIKNTLMRLILSENELEPPAELFIGPTLVAFCYQDVPPIAKLFRDFAKEVEEQRFVVKGALLEGEYLSQEQTATLADMPSREVLFAQVLGTINAPASQMVGVVASGIRQVVNVIQAYVDKLEEAGGSTAEAAA